MPKYTQYSTKVFRYLRRGTADWYRVYFGANHGESFVRFLEKEGNHHCQSQHSRGRVLIEDGEDLHVPIVELADSYLYFEYGNCEHCGVLGGWTPLDP